MSSKLLSELNTACRGLTYISETDAPLVPFVGPIARRSTPSVVARATSIPSSHKCEEIGWDEFFGKLTTRHDWFGERDKERARRFSHLRQIMEVGLDDLRVFRFGKVRIEIVVVGRDKDGRLIGFRTTAVET